MDNIMKGVVWEVSFLKAYSHNHPEMGWLQGNTYICLPIAKQAPGPSE